MNDPTTHALRMFVSTAPGLEPLAEREARAAGASALRAVAGGVEIEGDEALLYRLALELGVAIALLVRVATFRVRRFETLEREAARVPWERYVPAGAALEVRARARKSRLHHTGAIEERILRAIEARVGSAAATGERRVAHATTSDDRAAVRIHARIDHDECTLSYDASGEPLHRRGYKLATAKAPLREDLARALLLLSGWDRETPLLDPFCGSGTICIEAAWLARQLPPGHLRRFAFERAPFFDADRFAAVRREAMARARAAPPSLIEGSDRDPGAVDAARDNAVRAGVDGQARFVVAPVGESPLFTAEWPAHGAVVTNPPYGLRVGNQATLAKLYRTLGDRIRRLPAHFRVGLLVADARFARATGLPLEQALLTDHGGTKVRVMVTPRPSQERPP